MSDPDWQADLLRYPRRPWLKEQSIWAIAVYRFGRRIDRRSPGFLKKLLGRAYWLMFRIVETVTGISIPKSVQVGPGLKIWHFGNIFVHADSVLGANCTLRQGVTIGNREEDGPAPILEDDVDLGAYAQVLGGVRVGQGAKVGAMSVVLRDVPAGATAVGIPARIIERSSTVKSPTARSDTPRPAVFLDRDGTIIEHVHYLADPAKVRLLPAAAPALRRFLDAGYALVVITNQSAIGRGMITVDQYEQVDAEMRRQLLAEGVRLAGVYYCPELPVGDDLTVVTHADRKPGGGMLVRASHDLGLDRSKSWMIGDMISDALAGRNAGCLGSLLVRTGKQPPVDEPESGGEAYFSTVDDLSAAADTILGSTDDLMTLPKGEPS